MPFDMTKHTKMLSLVAAARQLALEHATGITQYNLVHCNHTASLSFG